MNAVETTILGAVAGASVGALFGLIAYNTGSKQKAASDTIAHTDTKDEKDSKTKKVPQQRKLTQDKPKRTEGSGNVAIDNVLSQLKLYSNLAKDAYVQIQHSSKAIAKVDVQSRSDNRLVHQIISNRHASVVKRNCSIMRKTAGEANSSDSKVLFEMLTEIEQIVSNINHNIFLRCSGRTGNDVNLVESPSTSGDSSTQRYFKRKPSKLLNSRSERPHAKGSEREVISTKQVETNSGESKNEEKSSETQTSIK